MIPVKKHVATSGRKNSLLIGTHLIQNKRIYSVWQELGHDKINVVIPTQNMTAGHAEQPKDLGLCLLGWCVFFFLLSNKLCRFSVFLALLWTFDVFNSARSTWRVRIQSKSCCWICRKSLRIIRLADGIQTFTWTRAEELPPPTHLKPHFIHSAHKSRLVSRWRRKSRCRAEELSSAPHPRAGSDAVPALQRSTWPSTKLNSGVFVSFEFLTNLLLCLWDSYWFKKEKMSEMYDNSASNIFSCFELVLWSFADIFCHIFNKKINPELK